MVPKIQIYMYIYIDQKELEPSIKRNNDTMEFYICRDKSFVN